MTYAASQEQLVYQAIRLAAPILIGSRISANDLGYFPRRNGSCIESIKVKVPSSAKLNPEEKTKIDEFAQRVNLAFNELKLRVIAH